LRKIISCFKILMILIFYNTFISCKTTNITIPAGKAETVQIEERQNSGMHISKEKIPIMAYYGVMEHTVERYRELKETGIDINFSYHANIENLAKAMDAAKETGVMMIIQCPELEKETENVVNRFKDHPALAGYFLKDEPGSKDFPRLGELVRRIQAIDNKHFCYVNLFGDGAPPKYYGTETYREYLQLFVKEVPVQIMSFDTYPVRIDKSGVRYLTDLFYENLEIFSDEAKKAGKPFWAFALTTPHWSYPIPTLADLRLQVFSNLAYGAQGIQYFTYWTPTPYEAIDFHDGPIDPFTQQKTATWYKVQQMSKEIKDLSNIFYGAQVLQVRHIVINASGENEDVPIGTTRFDFANRPKEASIIKEFIPSNRTNALVSFLKNGNRCYMVIVNRNLEGGDNVTFTIKGGTGLQFIKKDDKAVPASSVRSKQTITPGDALIYGWDIN